MKAALAHARWELGLTLRNGEQLLLTLIIPPALLIGICLTTDLPNNDGLTRIESAFPIVCMVSLIATCFTSLAIGTGFERRSGALTFLATTPLRRQGLVTGKVLATVALASISLAIVSVVALLFGWRPEAAAWWALPTILIAGIAFASWALVIASVFRAEAVLAIANALFLVLIVVGGASARLSSMTGGAVFDLIPSAALANALRSCLGVGIAPCWSALVVLAVWAVLGFVLARSRFRWQ